MTLAALSVGAAQAQDEPETRTVTIVNADSVAGSVVGGERIRTLVGNVHLIQDSTDLRANRATQFLDRNEILFEGEVEIADDVDTLNAVTVRYDSGTRVGRAQDDVRLADDESELFSNSVIYFRSAKRAEFAEPVRLVEREGGAVLTSLRGTYFTGRKEALFEGDVQLVDSVTVLRSERGRYGTEDQRADFFDTVRLQHAESTRLEADTLVHFRDTSVSRARGNVMVERFGGRDEAPTPPDTTATPPDTTRRTLLFGGEVYHDERARYSRVEIDPLLVRLQADSTGATDTLIVRAELLEASQPDSLAGRPPPPGGTFQRLIARRDVRLLGPSLAAVADSAVFDRIEFDSTRAEPTRDEVRLYRDPVGWLSAEGSAVVTEISGDSIRATARSESIDSVRVIGRAFAARPDSVLGRVNQIRGRQMLALFADDSLRWMKVWPAAEAVYFRADDEDRLGGAVRFSADSLAFRFDGDDLRRVQGVRGVEGTYYDAGLVPDPLRLDGFRYAPERRPTRPRLLADDPFERRRDSPPYEPPPAPPAEPLSEPTPPSDLTVRDEQDGGS